MHVSITGRHIEVTPSLKEYTNKKITKLNKYISGSYNAHIILSVEKYRHYAEVNISFNGVRLHSKEETSDMYTSIDKVIHKIEYQVKKIKDKLHKNKHITHTFIEENEPTGTEEDEQREFTDDTSNSTNEPTETDQQSFSIQPIDLQSLTPEDAIFKLNEKRFTFLMFFNIHTKKTSVIYRKDGDNYGLIEPLE